MQSLDLGGHELWLTYIENVHLIPLVIDCDRFQNALTSATRIYRHTCGRLSTDGNKWKIKLNDLEVPLITEFIECIQFSSRVVQDASNLHPFLHPRAHKSPVNADASLLLVKLSLSPEATAVGISWHHTLGDATTLFRFMHLVSQLYQGLTPAFPLPILQSTHFSTPPNSLIESFGPLIPHLVDIYHVSEIGAKYASRNQSIVHIHKTLSRTRFELIQAKLQLQSLIKISLQDSITAYLVSLLNTCQEQLVTNVTNAASYRGFGTDNPDIAGNQIYVVPSETFTPSQGLDAPFIALKIRESLIRARDPKFLQDYMTVASHAMLLAANENNQMFFGSNPQTLSVNSNLSLHWQSIEFGSGHAHFYTSGVSRLYLRVFPSNSNDDSIDLSLGIPSNLESQVLDAFRYELEQDTI